MRYLVIDVPYLLEETHYLVKAADLRPPCLLPAWASGERKGEGGKGPEVGVGLQVMPHGVGKAASSLPYTLFPPPSYGCGVLRWAAHREHRESKGQDWKEKSARERSGWTGGIRNGQGCVPAGFLRLGRGERGREEDDAEMPGSPDKLTGSWTGGTDGKVGRCQQAALCLMRQSRGTGVSG
jgi:hypothetical protein